MRDRRDRDALHHREHRVVAHVAHHLSIQPEPHEHRHADDVRLRRRPARTARRSVRSRPAAAPAPTTAQPAASPRRRPPRSAVSCAATGARTIPISRFGERRTHGVAPLSAQPARSRTQAIAQRRHRHRQPQRNRHRGNATQSHASGSNQTTANPTNIDRGPSMTEPLRALLVQMTAMRAKRISDRSRF